jgi:hypothetical protein
VWTKFTGMSVLSASTLTGGNRLDNVNLLLDSGSLVNKYPSGTDTTELSEIHTKNLYFNKGMLKKMKADFVKGEQEVEMVSILTKDKIVDGETSEITKENSIENIKPNHWRGISLGKNRGKQVSFKIKNANIVKSIMYDLKVEE